MFKIIHAVCLSLAISSQLFTAAPEGEHTGEIRVVPVDRMPEPDEVEVRIVYPVEGSVEEAEGTTVQLRVESYPLGVYTDFTRAREIRDSKNGQSIQIIVDGNPPLAINEAIDEMSETEEIDYDQTIETKIPYKLSPGTHVLRVFPVRSFNEALKDTGVFVASYFYVGEKSRKPSIDLSKPFLTYNQPRGQFDAKQPILLDFFVSNTQLSQDGYKVRLTIDNSDKRILTTWNPYYIYGLKPGSHTIKLELLSPTKQVIAPLFSDLTQTITVR